jgi:uncharacterized membrane protein
MEILIEATKEMSVFIAWNIIYNELIDHCWFYEKILLLLHVDDHEK